MVGSLANVVVRNAFTRSAIAYNLLLTSTTAASSSSSSTTTTSSSSPSSSTLIRASSSTSSSFSFSSSTRLITNRTRSFALRFNQPLIGSRSISRAIRSPSMPSPYIPVQDFSTTTIDGFPTHVNIVEVGPRDGLQNEQRFIPTPVKIQLIDRLSHTGLRTIEAGSFVRPDWVPQMRDGKEVLQGIRRVSGVSYPVLVPNLRGYEAAKAANADQIAIFTSASETFAKRNTNCTIEQSFDRIAPIIESARLDGIPVRGYISCVVGCPDEGPINPTVVAQVAERLYKLGCYEISLGDTIGVGTPGTVTRMLEAVKQRVPVSALAGHYHDTYGQALANILASLRLGVATFDSSVGGLGGCPYARGATGNVATEDVVYMLNGLGIETGVDLDELVSIADFISAELGRAPASHVAPALLNKRRDKAMRSAVKAKLDASQSNPSVAGSCRSTP